MSATVSKYLQLALRLLVGGVFVYAGLLKIKDPVAFADSIASFSLLPNSFVNVVALSLPILELAAGFLLIFGLMTGPVCLTFTLLAIAFAVALSQALVRGLPVDCGCFGSGEPSPLKTWLALGRDVLLLMACAWLYWKSRQPFARQSQSQPPDENAIISPDRV